MRGLLRAQLTLNPYRVQWPSSTSLPGILHRPWRGLPALKAGSSWTTPRALPQAPLRTLIPTLSNTPLLHLPLSFGLGPLPCRPAGPWLSKTVCICVLLWVLLFVSSVLPGLGLQAVPLPVYYQVSWISWTPHRSWRSGPGSTLCSATLPESPQRSTETSLRSSVRWATCQEVRLLATASLRKVRPECSVWRPAAPSRRSNDYDGSAFVRLRGLCAAFPRSAPCGWLSWGARPPGPVHTCGAPKRGLLAGTAGGGRATKLTGTRERSRCSSYVRPLHDSHGACHGRGGGWRRGSSWLGFGGLSGGPGGERLRIPGALRSLVAHRPCAFLFRGPGLLPGRGSAGFFVQGLGPHRGCREDCFLLCSGGRGGAGRSGPRGRGSGAGGAAAPKAKEGHHKPQTSWPSRLAVSPSCSRP